MPDGASSTWLSAPFGNGIVVTLEVPSDANTGTTLHGYEPTTQGSSTSPDIDSDLDFGTRGKLSLGHLVSGSSQDCDGVWIVDSTWAMTNLDTRPNVSSALYDQSLQRLGARARGRERIDRLPAQIVNALYDRAQLVAIVPDGQEAVLCETLAGSWSWMHAIVDPASSVVSYLVLEWQPGTSNTRILRVTPS